MMPSCTLYTTAIIENITEFRPEVCGEVAQQGTLVWLMKRLKVGLLASYVCLLCQYIYIYILHIDVSHILKCMSD